MTSNISVDVDGTKFDQVFIAEGSIPQNEKPGDNLVKLELVWGFTY